MAFSVFDSTSYFKVLFRIIGLAMAWYRDDSAVKELAAKKAAAAAAELAAAEKAAAEKAAAEKAAAEKAAEAEVH